MTGNNEQEYQRNRCSCSRCCTYQKMTDITLSRSATALLQLVYPAEGRGEARQGLLKARRAKTKRVGRTSMACEVRWDLASYTPNKGFCPVNKSASGSCSRPSWRFSDAVSRPLLTPTRGRA